MGRAGVRGMAGIAVWLAIGLIGNYVVVVAEVANYYTGAV